LKSADPASSVPMRQRLPLDHPSSQSVSESLGRRD
jgi:hypothetical protein